MQSKQKAKKNKKTAVVSGGKEARDNMYIIAISAMLSKAG
jgi:hypothetical protein